MIVGYMYQRAHPQLHLAEDAAQAPHILVFEITTVAPAIHLYGEFVLPLTQIAGHIKLCGRHGVLAIAHLLPIHPEIHGRMYTAEVENQILRKHLLGHVEESDILSYRITVLVSRPVLWRFTGHTGTVALERIIDIGIDRRAITLCLPVAWHLYLPPAAHVIVLTIEIRLSLLRIAAPTKQPLAVKTDDLLTSFPFRGQLQSGVIRQFVDAQHGRVLPVVGLGLC